MNNGRKRPERSVAIETLEPPRIAARFVLLAIGCVAGDWFGLRVPVIDEIALIGFPAGIALAALWRWGASWWPAVFVGALAFELVRGNAPAVAAALAAAGTLGPIIAVLLAGRHGDRGSNDRRDLMLLAGAAAVGVALSATIGAGALVAFGRVPVASAGTAWMAWFFGDLGGVALATPFLLSLSSRAWIEIRTRGLEALALLLVTGFIGAVVSAIAPGFGGTSLPITLLALLPVAWAATRFGVAGGSTAALIIAGFGLVGAARGSGPFVLPEPYVGWVLLWVYLASLAVLSLFVALLRAEQAGAQIRLSENADALQSSRRRYEELVGSLPVGVYRARVDPADAIVYEYASPLFCTMFDLAPESFPSSVFRDRILSRIHPDDLASLARVNGDDRAVAQPVSWQGRVIVRGEQRWMQLHVAQTQEDNGERTLFGVATDITDRRRIELQQSSERAVLEALARDEPLPVVLTKLVAGFELAYPGTLGAVALQDADQRRLRAGAGPHLPATLAGALDGAPIGPDAGVCGTAAYTGKPVIVTDIANDPRWREQRDLFLPHGLAACASFPLFSSRRDVLGTFAIHFREPRAPRPDELAAIERCSHLASLAIERHAAQQALAASEARYRRFYNNTPAMQYAADLDGTLVGVSDFWLASMGYQRDEVIGRLIDDFLTPASARHFRDVALPDFRRRGVRHNSEFQQVKKSGEVIDVLVSTHAERDANGEIVRSLSSLVDITERKRLETLREYENAILEMMASGAPEDEVLLRLITAYQAMHPGMICSILQVLPDGGHLGRGIGPGLPAEFRAAVDGIAIGPKMCSCGSAAYTRAPTLVADIANDPLWRKFRDLALEHGLAACWSFPIVDSAGAALGTFAAYYHEVRAPRRDELASLERGAKLASLALERARTLAALRDGESRFRRFYNDTPALLCSFDREGRLESVSDYWLAVAGYERAEVLGRPIDDFVQDVFRDDPGADGLRGLLRSGECKDLPCQLVKKGGAIIDVLLSAMAERDARGRIERSLAVMTDVTGRKRAEAALQRHGENLAALHRFTLDLLDRRDMKELLQTIVERAATMIGASFGELLMLGDDRLETRAFTRNQPPPPAEGVGRGEGPLAWKAVDTHQPAVIDDYASWPLRRRIYDPLQLRAVADFPVLLRGQCIGVLEMARTDSARSFTADELQQGMLFAQMAALVIDHLRAYESALSELAERTRAEAALREHEARLAGIIDSAIDAIITVDDAQRIVVFNNAAEGIFGSAEADALGQPLDRFIPEHARVTQSERAPRDGTGPRRKGETVRLTGRRAGGGEFPIEAAISRVEVGGRTLCTVVLRDISEKLRAETKEAELQAQLREAGKLEAIGTLAGGIAHDFNNIVGAILGNAELMRDELDASHPARRSLEEIHKAGHRARDLTRQILAFSRNEPQQRQLVDLKALVNQTSAMLRPIIPAGVEVATRVADGEIFVEGDPAQLQQALVNLCTNAWHALQGGGGRIDVLLDTLDIGGTPPAGLGRGRYAHLTVRDQGIGMDAATIARIFEPFYTTRAGGEGSGLGLSVVHGIVKSHNGRVDVASEPGQGSTFHVYLPAVAPPRAAQPPASALEAPPETRPGRVLYVDDDEALVFLVTRMLQRQGLEVTGLLRASDALEAMRADPGRFDLLLTDFNMPGMNGIDLAREAARLRPDLPVILTSGYITDEVRAAAVHAGIRHLVYKPNTVDELCEVVQRLMRQTRAK